MIFGLLLPSFALAILREKQGVGLNLEVFQLVDRNKDSFIDENEGLHGFDSWKPYDVNQDGKLSLKEFSALGHAAQRLEEASLLEEKHRSKTSARARCLPGSPKDIFMFQLADQDKSGFIEEQEGLSGFDWKVFDNNKDGKLDPKEFMILVQESLRLEDEGPELKDDERQRRFSAPINRHDASLSENATSMMRRSKPTAPGSAGGSLKQNPASQNPSSAASQLPDVDYQLGPERSAFEPDHWNDLSEYFGPFRIDYSEHTIEVPGWNFVIESPSETPGRGNLIVGNQNFYSDADNTFIAGKHNTARGFQLSIVGGKDNVGEGHGVVIIGGEQNAARGNLTVIDGGYRNEASGNYGVAEGGVKNVVTGDFASTSGGQSNIAMGYGTSVTGGKANEAIGRLSAVHGGSGNKAKGEMSVIGGGVGQVTETEIETIFFPLTDQDRETVQDPDHVGNHFT
jgi:hypothetical protein